MKLHTLKTEYKQQKKLSRKNLESLMFNIGGVGGIRTHARDKPSNDLANRPLQPA